MLEIPTLNTVNWADVLLKFKNNPMKTTDSLCLKSDCLNVSQCKKCLFHISYATKQARLDQVEIYITERIIKEYKGN